MAHFRVELMFPHDYEVELAEELPPGPGRVKQIYFPGGSDRGGRDGILLEVIPTGAARWIGIFARRQIYSGDRSGVFSCPDRRSLCVVSAGRGYIVRADDPRVWQEVPCEPIDDVVLSREAGLILFTDFDHLIAYGPDGLAWETERTSWDGLWVTEVTREHVRGVAWDPFVEREVEFLVDTRTGRHEGGSYSEEENP
jgi:hypothetical protein